MANYLNDGSGDAPKLRIYLNTDTLLDPPAGMKWPSYPEMEGITQLQADGFEGV